MEAMKGKQLSAMRATEAMEAMQAMEGDTEPMQRLTWTCMDSTPCNDLLVESQSF